MTEPPTQQPWALSWPQPGPGDQSSRHASAWGGEQQDPPPLALPRDQMGTLAISITARGQGSLLLGPASSLVQVPVSPPLVLCPSSCAGLCPPAAP